MKTGMTNKARKGTVTAMLGLALAFGATPLLAHPMYLNSDGRSNAPIAQECCDRSLNIPLVPDSRMRMEYALSKLDLLVQLLRMVTGPAQPIPSDWVRMYPV